MPQLMGYDIHFLILYAYGSHPKRADEIVVHPTIGRVVKGILDHDHHLVAVGFGRAFHPSQRVTEEMLEMLRPVPEIVQSESHRLAIQERRVVEVLPEPLLPHEDEVGVSMLR